MFSSAMSRSWARCPSDREGCCSPVSASTRKARERAGVAAEQGVRQRAVAPEEPVEVELDEQLGQGVEHRHPQLVHGLAGEQHPVGQREREVTGDEHGVERLAVVTTAAAGHADGLDHRRRTLLQVAQEPELPVGDAVLLLLERVHGVAVGDEAHDVTGDPAHGRHHPHRLPGFERLLPGEVDEGGVTGAGGEPEPHARIESPVSEVEEVEAAGVDGDLDRVARCGRGCGARSWRRRVLRPGVETEHVLGAARCGLVDAPSGRDLARASTAKWTHDLRAQCLGEQHLGPAAADRPASRAACDASPRSSEPHTHGHLVLPT